MPFERKGFLILANICAGQIQPMKSKSLIVEIIASLFVLLFVYTALSKWFDFENFKAVIAQSPLIGSIPTIIAWLLPLLELWVAGLLLFRLTRLVGLYASLILMIVFTGYLIYMLMYSPELPCSCGGVLRYLSWRTHVLFNIVLIVMAITAIKMDASKGVSRKPV